MLSNLSLSAGFVESVFFIALPWLIWCKRFGPLLVALVPVNTREHL
jgi:hypothetical protein